MTYEQFKRINDESKQYFVALGRLSNINLRAETCTLSTAGNVTNNVPIKSLVEDITNNGMGAIVNPSLIKNWRGFDPRFQLK